MFAVLNPSESITAVLAGAPATTQPTYTARYRDSGEEQQATGLMAGVTAVTVVSAPRDKRYVDNVRIANSDTAAVVVTVNKVVGGVSYPIIPSLTLQAGDTLVADANGVRVATNSGGVKSATIGGSLGSNGIGASTAAAGTTTTDATVLPAATAGVYPTTAADDNAGVRIHADDKVTSRLLMIGNGVSNKILKVYPPTGGTVNGAAANAAFSSVSGKGVIAVCLSASGNTWLMW